MNDETTTRRPTHRTRRRPFEIIRGLLGTAAAVVGTTVAVVAVSTGSLASWVDTAVTTPGVVTAGSAGLDVTSTFAPASWSNLLVGESARQSFTIANTGDVPLALTATGTSSAAGYELRVVLGTCPATALVGSSITTTSASLGTLGPGAAPVAACLEVRLGAGAQPGTTSTLSVVVTGTQVQ